MHDHKQMMTRLTEAAKRIPKKWWIAIGLAAICLIAVSEWFPSSKTTNATQSVDVRAYAEQLEERLTTMVESMEGAGNCHVMVTLENGVEYIYANEQSNTSDRVEDHSATSDKTTVRDDTESSYVIIHSADGRQGLLVTEIQPTVRGVVVICDGGENAELRDRIRQMVSTALNITASRVCVTT